MPDVIEPTYAEGLDWAKRTLDAAAALNAQRKPWPPELGVDVIDIATCSIERDLIMRAAELFGARATD